MRMRMRGRRRRRRYLDMNKLVNKLKEIRDKSIINQNFK